MDDLIDRTKIHPIPTTKTALLVNNFILNTTKFLNNFSEQCELKLSSVSSRIMNMEVTMVILEAKLNSIPGLEFADAALPNTIPIQNNTTNAQSSTVPSNTSSNINNSNNNVAATTPVVSSTALVVSQQPNEVNNTTQEIIPDQEITNSNMVKIQNHPYYSKFFKMKKVGIPEPQIMFKMTTEGLDPNLLNDPDFLIESPPDEENQEV